MGSGSPHDPSLPDDDTLDAAAVVGMLAEPVRLRALAALILGAETLGGVAAAAEISVSAALRALERLVNGGLVEVTPGDRHSPTVYRVREERLTATAKANAAAANIDPSPKRFVFARTPLRSTLLLWFSGGAGD